MKRLPLGPATLPLPKQDSGLSGNSSAPDATQLLRRIPHSSAQRTCSLRGQAPEGDDDSSGALRSAWSGVCSEVKP